MRHALCALALAFAPGAANAASLFEVPEQNGLRMAQALAISGDGRTLVGVCSSDEGSDVGCRWSVAGGLEPLAVPQGEYGMPLAVSRDGAVAVGWRAETVSWAPRAVRWGPDGAVLDLEPEQVSLTSEALDVSNDGSSIVGWRAVGDERRAFRWTEGGGIELLPEGSIATAMSGDGSTIAACCVQRGFSHWPAVPFLWRAGAPLVALPKIHGSGDQAYAISADGKVLVLGPDDDFSIGFSWRWSQQDGAQPILKPSPALPYARPAAASADGAVVVGADGPYTGLGFVWTAAAGARLLKDALADAGVDVSAWSALAYTRSLSDDGCTVPAMGIPANGSGTYVVVIATLCDAAEVAAAPRRDPLGREARALVVTLAFAAAALVLLRGHRTVLLALALLAPAAAHAAGIAGIEPRQGIRLGDVRALSGDGLVLAGRCHSAATGFAPCRWRTTSGPEWLGSPDPPFTSVRALSGDGAVVAGDLFRRGIGGHSRAVYWTADGQFHELTGLPAGFIQSGVQAVSADGATILGWVQVDYERHPFRWTSAGGMEVLAGWQFVAFADDGRRAIGSDAETSFLWRDGEPPLPLPDPGGALFLPQLLSADGSAVAGTTDAFPGAEALRWTESQGTAPLGPASYPFFLQPEPRDLSADGSLVVGTDLVAGAFVWSAEHGLRRLGDALAVEHGVDVRDWDLYDVVRVSDDGRTAVAYAYEGGAITVALVNLAPACDDGLDNDGDGQVDMADTHCTSPDQLRERRPGCGLGFELVMLAPLLGHLARRRRAEASTRTRR